MATIALPRYTKTLPTGPSRLSKILDHLNQQPRLQLPNVTNLKIELRAKDGGSGPRHFVKNALPRIRYANPSLTIEAEKVWTGKVKPRIELTFSSGETQTIPMKSKSPSVILQQLMDIAGGDPWLQYKRKRQEEGLPLFTAPEGPNPLVNRPQDPPTEKKARAPVTPIKPPKPEPASPGTAEAT
ncbi:hypothetical protein D9756_004328 [Leucocoprinus leucothites]|uniref:Ribosomal protein/NADH dehydrogenase domain-containing protein n=1 Tax=Leucocoprinus leucothites TaxID=201217 RepID=A0A8H5G0V2_9AGAR|nr:hypothetical protein D9756_004328 [Leucoagaricus leucothites]